MSKSIDWFVVVDGVAIQKYPCHCGVTHDRVEDYNHHNCLHGTPLIWLDKSDGELMCMDCGQVFEVAEGEK